MGVLNCGGGECGQHSTSMKERQKVALLFWGDFWFGRIYMWRAGWSEAMRDVRCACLHAGTEVCGVSLCFALVRSGLGEVLPVS